MKRVAVTGLGVISPLATTSPRSGTPFAPARAASARSQNSTPRTIPSSSPPRCATLTPGSTWKSWTSCTAMSIPICDGGGLPGRGRQRHRRNARRRARRRLHRQRHRRHRHVYDRAFQALKPRPAPRLPVFHPHDDPEHSVQHDRHTLSLPRPGHADGHSLRLRHKRHRRSAPPHPPRLCRRDGGRAARRRPSTRWPPRASPICRPSPPPKIRTPLPCPSTSAVRASSWAKAPVCSSSRSWSMRSSAAQRSTPS